MQNVVMKGEHDHVLGHLASSHKLESLLHVCDLQQSMHVAAEHACCSGGCTVDYYTPYKRAQSGVPLPQEIP